ncbi:hypothetical protein HDU97_008094 [Phlyctochytrium planicorne]|nr:hypothetical protein HDU97_008094 [Phlyctochytrium planicorne]
MSNKRVMSFSSRMAFGLVGAMQNRIIEMNLQGTLRKNVVETLRRCRDGESAVAGREEGRRNIKRCQSGSVKRDGRRARIKTTIAGDGHGESTSTSSEPADIQKTTAANTIKEEKIKSEEELASNPPSDLMNSSTSSIPLPKSLEKPSVDDPRLQPVIHETHGLILSRNFGVSIQSSQETAKRLSLQQQTPRHVSATIHQAQSQYISLIIRQAKQVLRARGICNIIWGVGRSSHPSLSLRVQGEVERSRGRHLVWFSILPRPWRWDPQYVEKVVQQPLGKEWSQGEFEYIPEDESAAGVDADDCDDDDDDDDDDCD